MPRSVKAVLTTTPSSHPVHLTWQPLSSQFAPLEAQPPLPLAVSPPALSPQSPLSHYLTLHSWQWTAVLVWGWASLHMAGPARCTGCMTHHCWHCTCCWAADITDPCSLHASGSCCGRAWQSCWQQHHWQTSWCTTSRTQWVWRRSHHSWASGRHPSLVDRCSMQSKAGKILRWCRL